MNKVSIKLNGILLWRLFLVGVGIYVFDWSVLFLLIAWDLRLTFNKG